MAAVVTALLEDLISRGLSARRGLLVVLDGGKALAAGVRAVAEFDLKADLAKVDAPVTILNGHLDQFRGQERRFARAAPRSRLVVLGYGTHMVNLTHPGPYTDTLEQLLLDADVG